MSEKTPSDKDPVRIVYHVGDRTFARLFKERSLEEVKDVVRRKLGLGSQTDVSLKQMGSGTLLDLEDDDDFQAFRVLVRSSVSVDIQVTVNTSRGATVLPPVVRELDEHPSVSKPAAMTFSPSKEPGIAAPARPIVQTQVTRTEASTTPAEATKPSQRKRKVSFDSPGVAATDKRTEPRLPAKFTAVTPIVTVKTAESPAAPAPVVSEEPPKKKQKKEPTRTKTKTKDAQITEAVESSATKASTRKAQTGKCAPTAGGSKAGTSVSRDTGTSESPAPARKLRKQKKDDNTSSKKSSASVGNYTSMDRLMGDPNIRTIVSLQSAAETSTGSAAEGDTPKFYQRPPKGMICASIPQTSASNSVRAEVAAAILSLSKASETIPHEPFAKKKPVKKGTKKSFASPSVLPAEPEIMSNAPASQVPNTERRPEQVVLTSEPSPNLNDPSCPICLETPFHIRYYCPTVQKGPDAIRKRLEELKRTNMNDQQLLIKQLEGLLGDPKVTSELSLDTALVDDVQSGNMWPSQSAPLPKTPNIPGNSCLSEVTVESRDEGSSSEPDDLAVGGVEHQDSSAPRRQRTPDWWPSPSNDDLEAIVCGPASKRQSISILHLLDRIVGDEGAVTPDSEEDVAELEEDPDEETGYLRHLSSRRNLHSSDSESEEEESRSPSPSRPADDISNNNLGPGPQGSKKSAKESTEHLNGDVVMRDSVDPPVLEGRDDDGSEGTHVGSEGRMAADESTGEKGVAIVTEVQPSSPLHKNTVLQPSNAPNNEPQESAKTGVDPCFHRNGSSVPPASQVLEEVEADPIQPADDLASPTASHSSNSDSIELDFEDTGSLYAGLSPSTPKLRVSKRIKTRSGRILDDEADHPVLLKYFSSEAADRVTHFSTRRWGGNRELRRSSRLRSKSGTRVGEAAKTLAKGSQEVDASQRKLKDTGQDEPRIAPAPPLIQWETLPEPSSPSVQLDDPSMLIDELVLSSPHPEGIPARCRLNDKKEGRSRKPAFSTQAESSQREERLFDPSSSQIPFPYSQKYTNPAAETVRDGEESEETTELEDGPLAKVAKKTKAPVQYRPLSQLASAATFFSPSLPTPANKPATNGEPKNRAADEDSSSSSSDADEANGSEHIPLERRAGTVLETKKRKSLLSRM